MEYWLTGISRCVCVARVIHSKYIHSVLRANVHFSMYVGQAALSHCIICLLISVSDWGVSFNNFAFEFKNSYYSLILSLITDATPKIYVYPYQFEMNASYIQILALCFHLIRGLIHSLALIKQSDDDGICDFHDANAPENYLHFYWLDIKKFLQLSKIP